MFSSEVLHSFFFVFCQGIKLFSTESYLHVYMQFLERVFEESPNFIRLSSIFLMNLYSSPVSAHARASLCHVQCNTKHFQGKVYFQFSCYTIFFANHVWRFIRKKCLSFNFDISIWSYWNFSVIQETIASALGEGFSENSKRSEHQ